MDGFSAAFTIAGRSVATAKCVIAPPRSPRRVFWVIARKELPLLEARNAARSIDPFRGSSGFWVQMIDLPISSVWVRPGLPLELILALTLWKFDVGGAHRRHPAIRQSD